MVLHFHNPAYACKQHCNLHQKIASLLQSIFTSLLHPYLLAKSSLQSPVTSPSPTPQQFFTNLFLHTAYSRCNYLYQKYFPCLNHFINTSAIKAESRDQEPRETCEYWHCFNLSLLPKIMEGDSRAHNH